MYHGHVFDPFVNHDPVYDFGMCPPLSSGKRMNLMSFINVWNELTAAAVSISVRATLLHFPQG
jgi:hypothetical protein